MRSDSSILRSGGQSSTSCYIDGLLHVLIKVIWIFSQIFTCLLSVFELAALSMCITYNARNCFKVDFLFACYINLNFFFSLKRLYLLAQRK